ncbi:MAG: 3-oxo-tetronate kinase [Granulosicoccus sp.]
MHSSRPTSPTVLGCIADDFTGATDLAGLLARSGVKVSLRIGVPAEPPSDTAAFEVIALKCRTAPVTDAVDECLAALEWLTQAGATRFFWKYCSTFDSTAEGNIGPVAEALMQALDCQQTIYCPAFPENGRSIFMGNLFVARQPLAESPMKDHPLTPMRDSNLLRLLQPQVKQPVGLVDRLTVAQGSDAVRGALAELEDKGIAHVIVDAVANDDLTVIADACRDFPLITGGSAVAMPLPALYLADGTLSAESRDVPIPSTPTGTLILSGSCSQMTRQQVAFYKDKAPCYQLEPLRLAAQGVEHALHWLRDLPAHANPLVYATAEPADVVAAQEKLGTEAASLLIESALASLAVTARELGIRRFVVAGGESSGAVTKALDVQQLVIGTEIAPGVPWTYCQSAGHDIALALKSGNFGAVTFFEDAMSLLDD